MPTWLARALGTSTPPNSRAPEKLQSSSQQKPGTEGLIDTCARGSCLMNPNKIHKTLKTLQKNYIGKNTASLGRKAQAV